MSDPLIKLDNIHMSFQGREVLRSVSMAVAPAEIVTLIGPNGAGKTTLVRIALGLQAPTSGQRIIKPGLRIGYMPQKLHVDNSMPLTVQRFLSLTDNTRQAIHTALQRTGVSHVNESPLHSLSGGELQRVLLARALLNKPHILVLDEPVQGVDTNGQRELYQLISDLRSEQGCAILMISHDLHLVMASTDQVICINQHVCCSGHPSLVKKHPEYLRLFGGQSEELAIYTHHHDHHHGVDGHVIKDRNSQLKNEGKQ